MSYIKYNIYIYIQPKWRQERCPATWFTIGMSLSLPRDPRKLSQLYHPKNNMFPPDDIPHSLPNLPLRSTELGIATFNVRGLQSTTKRQSLASDMKAYALDFVGLQETKITTQLVEKLPGRYVLWCFPLSTRHHGIGFIVSPRLDLLLKKYWSVSDWVGVVEFVLPVTRRLRSNKLYVIVAYGPHSQYVLIIHR